MPPALNAWPLDGTRFIFQQWTVDSLGQDMNDLHYDTLLIVKSPIISHGRANVEVTSWASNPDDLIYWSLDSNGDLLSWTASNGDAGSDYRSPAVWETPRSNSIV